MSNVARQPVMDFYTYPAVGTDDWRYTYQTAQVRALEMQMLSKAALLDMANAENFQTAAALLSATEYALGAGGGFGELERVLQARRSAIRELFDGLMLDKPIVELFKTRDDFANLRLALRRMLTERPLGTDYSSEGNVAPELFEQVFEQENYDLLPSYISEAAEAAVLAYYKDKEIRQIDFAIDRSQAKYNLDSAGRLKSVFLLNLFRIQIDLTNIRTMCRLKFTESQQPNLFLEGGFIPFERLNEAMETGYEAMGQVFFVMPYYRVVETGANYLASNKSFLALERQCQDFLNGFIKSTIQITVGPQPIIAFLLLKENEIRTVRLILTAKNNALETRLILDRLGE